MLVIAIYLQNVFLMSSLIIRNVVYTIKMTLETYRQLVMLVLLSSLS